MAKDAAEAELEAELDKELGEEPVVDSAPETPAEPESPQASGALVTFARSLGLEVDPTATDEDVSEYIREQFTTAGRVQELEARNRELEALRLHQAQQAQSPEQPQTPVETPAAPARAKREVPEYDPEWESLLKLDDNGQIIPVASWVDPTIPAKYQRYQKWFKAEQARLMRDPDVVLSESGYEDRLKERLLTPALTPYEKRLAAIEETIKQQTQQRVVSQRDQFLLDNAHFYAETDAEGNVVRDTQGYIKPGANYQRFVDIEAELEKAGISDPAKRFELAARAVPPTPADSPQTPAATPQDKRAKVRNRVAGKINGKTIAQAPVSRSKGGAAELVDSPRSIGQLKNRWLGMLEQAASGDE